MKKLITILGAMALGIACASAAAATHWDMATPYPDANFHTRNDYQLAKDIKKATDGKLVITIHSGGSLIKHPQIQRAVRTGQVQAGEVFISILGNQNPIYSIDSVPFLATSYEQARQLWEASKPAIEKLMQQQGLKLLYVVPWPPQGLYTNREINSVEDLKGLKFRTNNTETSRLAKLTGMIPTQVEVPEVPQAFATGIVNAMLTSPSTGVNTQAWDYVKYYYNIQAWVPKNMVFVNQRAFDALDPSEQQAVLKAAQEAKERGWKMSEEEAHAMTKKLAEHGMKVSEPSAKLEQGLKEVGEKMLESWEKEAGATGKKIIEDYRKSQ